MANKIYTKTGDKGQTGLFGGSRVSKDDVRLEAYGTVDELNSFLGYLKDHVEDKVIQNLLYNIQNALFNAGSILATDPTKPEMKLPFDNSIINTLELEIDRMQEELPALMNFILPGGHPQVSLCHILRTVTRRAERRVVTLSDIVETDIEISIFLNRLSDYFFVLGRYLGKQMNAKEVIWNSGK
jgi:ATP:cob(I)alamin adenosyltransferase